MKSQYIRTVALTKTNYRGLGNPLVMIFGILLLSVLLLALRPPNDPLFHTRLWSWYLPQSAIYVSFFWISLRTVIHYSRRILPDWSDAPKRIFILMTVIIISLPIIRWLCVSVFFSFVYDEVRIESRFFTPSLLIAYVLALLIIGVSETFYFFNKYKEEVQERGQLELNKSILELQTIRNQINPMFLSSSLGALYQLIPDDQEAAMTYLSKLAKYYRLMSTTQPTSLHTLQQEISDLTLYAEILKVSTDGLVKINIDIEPMKDYLFPAMCIQLLIEKLIRNNLGAKKGAMITIMNIKDPLAIQVEFNKKLSAALSKDIAKEMEWLNSRFQYLTSERIVTSIGEESSFAIFPLIKKDEVLYNVKS